MSASLARLVFTVVYIYLFILWSVENLNFIQTFQGQLFMETLCISCNVFPGLTVNEFTGKFSVGLSTDNTRCLWLEGGVSDKVLRHLAISSNVNRCLDMKHIFCVGSLKLVLEKLHILDTSTHVKISRIHQMNLNEKPFHYRVAEFSFAISQTTSLPFSARPQTDPKSSKPINTFSPKTYQNIKDSLVRLFKVCFCSFL